MFIAEYPEDAYWSQWKPMVRGVISELETRGLINLFRIGQSMHHIVFSTLNHHQLTSEPRVTLEFHPKEQAVRIAYARSNLWFNEPLSQETIPFSTAVPRTIFHLGHL